MGLKPWIRSRLVKAAVRSCRLTEAFLSLTLPPGFPQPFDQMFVVFWSEPRNAVEDVHIECRRRSSDGLHQPFFRLGGTTKLAERSRRPAVDHREIGVRQDQALCRVDHTFVLAGEIKTAGYVQQTH